MLNLCCYGRITSNIEVKQSVKGNHLYTNFVLASHERKETTFIRCVAFDAMATLLQEFFTKGDRIILYGNLISDNYKGRKYCYKLKVRDIEFVETKDEHQKNVEKHSNKNQNKGDLHND